MQVLTSHRQNDSISVRFFHFFVREARAESLHSSKSMATMRLGVAWKPVFIDVTT